MLVLSVVASAFTPAGAGISMKWRNLFAIIHVCTSSAAANELAIIPFTWLLVM